MYLFYLPIHFESMTPGFTTTAWSSLSVAQAKGSPAICRADEVPLSVDGGASRSTSSVLDVRRSILALFAVGLVAACGQTQSVSVTNTAPTSVPEIQAEVVELAEAGDACVEFHRSAAASVEEEQLYMRRLADRIADLGHSEAAVILDDLANQWKSGTWEGEQDEVWQSGLWAEAGRLLSAEGAIRCADLAEWWGIDGYEGQPGPNELLRRQAQIWRSSRPSEYYVLVVGGRLGEPPTQVHAHVVGSEVVGSAVAEQGLLGSGELPLSVEQLYSWLLDEEHRVDRYDLANAAPAVMQVGDVFLQVFVDPDDFPPAVEVQLDVEETG